MNTFGLVKLNKALSPGQSGIGIKAQACVHFGGHSSWHRLKDFATKTHKQSIHHFVKWAPPKLADDCAEQRRIAGLLYGLENQRRIGRGILRPELSQLHEIPRVCDHSGELSQGIELVHGCLKHGFLGVTGT